MLAVIIAPSIFGVTIIFGVKSTVDTFNKAPVVAAGSTFDATTTGTYVLMVQSDANGDVTNGRNGCMVTGPDGSQIPVTDFSNSATSSQNGETYTATQEFDATAAGNYTIDCGSPTKVLSKSAVDGLIKSVVLRIFLAFGGSAVVGILGIVLLIVGIVKLVRSGRERRNAQFYGQGGPGGPYSGPYGGGPYNGGPGSYGGPTPPQGGYGG
ncbi:hypothetical protein [Rudaeicoccus suwonensis]|uniref:hypothetical protein n=1 Tax=Rudaeicoccus suwonensis TaxID=657409 RepID=UPI00119E1C67|nr:hypothetical protein [Rudaeicoccus suwonensis]